jgi:acetyl-CoA synthetase
MSRKRLDDHYESMCQGLGWLVPARFNMAQACATRWAEHADAAERIAVIEHAPGGMAPRTHSYAQLQGAADALSHALVEHGVKPGDRVAIVLPQRFETAVAYMAVLQLGAVAMPLSQLFGPDALSYRLQDSAAVLAIVDDSTVEAVMGVREMCADLRCVMGMGEAAHQADVDFYRAIASHQGGFVAAATRPDDPAVLIYTSGTTGPPKGALIPHRALLGNLTGFLCSQNWFGFPVQRQRPIKPHALPLKSKAVFWSPADWAWTGGLMDALLPTLYFGRPIVAWRGRFSPEVAFEILQRHGVTHSFLFPTALKAMMKAYPRPRDHYRFKLQAIMSAGEAVGDAVFDYCRDQLGVVVNEMFGQTEVNYIVGNCAMNDERSHGVGYPAKPGSMGKGYPGHRVAVIDDQGVQCPPNVVGEVAVHRLDRHGHADPVFFLGYWKNDKATAKKYTGDWCRTGDLAHADEDGYLWYQGRADDVFKSAGYRIGPSEIENCLVKHAAVANAAVVPKPDPERGALVKAYVVLAPGYEASDELVQTLQQHVRGQLAPYEYPKEIEFISALPMTTTGKVQRRVLRLQEEERFAKAQVGQATHQ